MAAEKLGIDPAVMASPFITTIVDALSLLIYFFFRHLDPAPVSALPAGLLDRRGFYIWKGELSSWIKRRRRKWGIIRGKTH